jgi:hypothetical protein
LDSSCIEGSHKGWNSLQRSFASGLKVFHALAHDFVLRQNICVGSAHNETEGFLKMTFGSHHIHLVSNVAALWNTLLQREKQSIHSHLPLPELQDVASGEQFSLVMSKHTETFGGLLESKEDDDDAEQVFNLPTHDDAEQADTILRDIGIDPALCFLPLNASTDSNIPGVSSAVIGADRLGTCPEPVAQTDTTSVSDIISALAKSRTYSGARLLERRVINVAEPLEGSLESEEVMVRC